MPGTLTVEGARYLCGARESIILDPASFDMGEWDCGSRACIAGHIARQVPALQGRSWSTRDISEVLGFGAVQVVPFAHPLSPLFFGDITDHDPMTAAARINAFLWQYGFSALGEPLEVACTG